MTLIVYRSLRGSSKLYAQWLAEEVGAIYKKSRETTKKELELADKIVLVGGTYAGMMLMSGFINRNLKMLLTKEVFYVNVGMAPENDPWNQKSWAKLPEEFRKKAKMYKIMGKMGKDDQVKKENLGKVIKDLL